MGGDGSGQGVEWFRPTSGRIVGTIGLGITAAVALWALVDGLDSADLATVSGMVFLSTLVWAALLRPKVGLTRDQLVLRNMLERTEVPLASIEAMAVRAVLAVRAGGKRYVCAGIGRSLNSLRKGGDPDPARRYPDFVEQRLRQRMDDARARAGVTMRSEEQAALASGVRRSPAWPEIILLVGSGVVAVGALLL